MSHNVNVAIASKAEIQVKFDLYHELLSDSITLAENISELSGDTVTSSTLSTGLALISENTILQTRLLLQYPSGSTPIKISPNVDTNGSIGSQINVRWDDFITRVQQLKVVIDRLLSGHPDSMDIILPKINNFTRLELNPADLIQYYTNTISNPTDYPRLGVGSVVFQRRSRGSVSMSDVDFADRVDVPPIFSIGTVYDIRSNIIVLHTHVGEFELTDNTFTIDGSTNENYYNDKLSVVLNGEQSPIFVTSGMVEDFGVGGSSVDRDTPQNAGYLSNTNQTGILTVTSLRSHDSALGSQTNHKPSINITTSVNTINTTVQTNVNTFTANHESIFGHHTDGNITGIIQQMQALVRKASIANSYFQALPSAEQKAAGFTDPELTTLHKIVSSDSLFPLINDVNTSGNVFLDKLHEVAKNKTTLLISEETKNLLTSTGDGTTSVFTLSDSVEPSSHGLLTVKVNDVLKSQTTKVNGKFSGVGQFSYTFDEPNPPITKSTVGLSANIPTSTDSVTSPVVHANFPANNAVDISSFTSISITFSKAMNRSTINTSNIIIKRDSDNTIISGVFTYLDNIGGFAGGVVTFNPSASLQYGESHSVIIGTGVVDFAGLALKTSHSFKFTTFSGNSNKIYFLTGTETGSPISHIPGSGQSISVLEETIVPTIDSETRSASYSEQIIGSGGLESPSGIDRLTELLNKLITTISDLDSALKAIEINKFSKNYDSSNSLNVALKSLWSLLRA